MPVPQHSGGRRPQSAEEFDRLVADRRSHARRWMLLYSLIWAAAGVLAASLAPPVGRGGPRLWLSLAACVPAVLGAGGTLVVVARNFSVLPTSSIVLGSVPWLFVCWATMLLFQDLL